MKNKFISFFTLKSPKGDFLNCWNFESPPLRLRVAAPAEQGGGLGGEFNLLIQSLQPLLTILQSAFNY
jgi:hypothetical protein